VMKKWTEEYYHEFTEDAVLKRELHDWIAHLSITKKSHADSLAASLNKAKRKLQESETRVVTEGVPEPKLPKNIWSPSLNFLQIAPLELARQIAVKQMAIFKHIRPQELLNQAWNNPKLKWRAPNVLAFIEEFNKLSLQIASAIIHPPTLNKRIGVLTHCIKVCQHLKDLNNFNALTALLSAMNSAAVHRLKFTREGVQPRYQEVRAELEKIVATESAYKVYRDCLEKATPPCLPYLGIHLTDLVFIEEIPNTITTQSGATLIHMKKRTQVFNVIHKIQQLQLCDYNLHYVHQIQMVFGRMPILGEMEAFNLSLLREPRGATREEIK